MNKDSRLHTLLDTTWKSHVNSKAALDIYQLLPTNTPNAFQMEQNRMLKQALSPKSVK